MGNENERLLVFGDSWRAILQRRTPGHTFMVIEIEGKQVGAVPLGNLLHIGAALDPEGASEEQKYVQQLRQEVWHWQSKYTDQLGNEARIVQLQGELATARAAKPVPESEKLLVERYQMLLLAAQNALRKCHQCGGTDAEMSAPCEACGMLRAVVAIQTSGGA